MKQEKKPCTASASNFMKNAYKTANNASFFHQKS